MINFILYDNFFQLNIYLNYKIIWKNKFLCIINSKNLKFGKIDMIMMGYIIVILQNYSIVI